MADNKVTIMNRAKRLTVLSVAMFALTACGSEKTEEPAIANVDIAKTEADVSFKSNDGDLAGATVTPGAPYRVSYAIVGTPVVGNPVTVDLQITSSSGKRAISLDYRINDASSMTLAESQPARVRMEPAANEADFNQRVTIIPQREGRFYLNVSVSFETENGTMSTVTAIPIQVGTGTRELQQNGRIEQDENGEAVLVLTSE